MKTILILPIYILSFFNPSYAQEPTIKVGFTEKSFIEQEGIHEKIIFIKIKVQGTWQENSDFKLKLKIGGDATEGFDYKILPNSKSLIIDKNKIEEYIFNLILLPDNKFEESEEITIEIEKDGNFNFVEIADNNENLFSKITITIKDNNPISDAIINRINGDRDTSDIIGTISLQSKSITVYELCPPSSFTHYRGTQQQVQKAFPTTNDSLGFYGQYEIDKVKIAFRSGVIAEINVYTKQGDNELIFTNIFKKKVITKRVPISIRHIIYRNELNDIRLFAQKNGINDKNRFIRVGDVLKYDPELAKNYPPSDGSIFLDNLNPTQELKINTSLNSYVGLNIYTDFLSLVGAEKGNGLVQTEASVHILTNTRNTKKAFLIWINFFEPYLKYSRFENGYNYVAPVVSGSETQINRMLLNQRSYLNTGLKINIFRKINRFYSEIELNQLTQFMWANIRGNALSPSPNEPQEYEVNKVNMLSYGLQLKSIVPLFVNFGMSLSWTSSLQKLWTNSDFSNSGYQLFHSPEIELSYNPLGRIQDKLFLRFRTLITNKDSEDKYVQLQVGYQGQFRFKTK